MSQPRETENRVRAMVYSAELATMRGHARAAIALARALQQRLPTDLVSDGPLSPTVADWASGLSVRAYERGMEQDYALLWNVDPNGYAEPLARRNLAWVAAPHANNVPPPQYELLGMSDHTVAAIEQRWQRVADRLYPAVTARPQWREKEPVILSVGRFVTPGPLADHGHLQAIQQYRQLVEAGVADWQLVLIGALAPGHGAYLDQLQQAAHGLNVRIVANADQVTLDRYLAVAAVYWHLDGLHHPASPPAQGAFPHALIEAAGHGAVPVAVNHGAAPEFVRHGYNGFLVDSGDQCVEITRDLARTASAWSILSQRAEVTSRGWTDFSVFGDRLESVLGGGRAARPPVERWLDEAPGQDQVCVIVAARNHAAMTRECLAALRELNPRVRIILVDDGSTEDLGAAAALAEASGGVALRREVNGGLGAALAEARDHCDRPFVAVLHNDVRPVVSGDWLDVLLAELADETVGVVGPKLKAPDGETVRFAGWAFSPENGGMFFHVGDDRRDEPRFNQRFPALGVSSACLVCRRELFDPDPGYRLVYSDLDLCMKASAAGWSTIYQPAAVLVHGEGATRRTLSNVEAVVTADRARFFERHAAAIEALAAGRDVPPDRSCYPVAHPG